jgi:elongation factor 1-gamma
LCSAEPKKKDPLDELPAGTFNLEEWKRQLNFLMKYFHGETGTSYHLNVFLFRFYSNNDEAASIAWFWEHFDAENYSIWKVKKFLSVRYTEFLIFFKLKS